MPPFYHSIRPHVRNTDELYPQHPFFTANNPSIYHFLGILVPCQSINNHVPFDRSHAQGRLKPGCIDSKSHPLYSMQNHAHSQNGNVRLHCANSKTAKVKLVPSRNRMLSEDRGRGLLFSYTIPDDIKKDTSTIKSAGNLWHTQSESRYVLGLIHGLLPAGVDALYWPGFMTLDSKVISHARGRSQHVSSWDSG